MSSAWSPDPLRLEDAPDELLADRSADGDRRAFAVLVARYERLLRSYARRVLGSSSASEDAVQDALVTAWQQLDSLHDRGAVRSWLIRITTRKALDHARAEREHADVDELDVPAAEELEPDRLAAASSLSGALAVALQRLPEQQRRVWVLRELGGYAYDEIAEELGLPPSTVRGALARARRTLVTELDGWR